MTTKPFVGSEPAEPVVCGTCNQVHPRCKGHSRRSGGGPCGRHATTGSAVCEVHGAAAPQVKAAIARRAQAAAAERAAATYGLPRQVNPVQALVELLHETAGTVAWLRDMIRTFEPDALIWGVADEINKGSGEFPGVDIRRAASPSVWLQRYDIERRLLLDVSEKLARLGIDWDAREAMRREGAALAKVGREFARRLGLDPSEARVVAAWRAALRDALGVGADADRVVEGVVA